MGENSFAPKTRQQDERQITKVQSRFDAGMFKDIPASTIPDNGIAELVDFKNMGNRLEGRSGSKLWSSTPLPNKQDSVTVTGSSVIGNNERESTVQNYEGITSSNIGDWLVFEDGTQERILDVSIAALTTITTRTFGDNSDAHLKLGDNCAIRGQVNGLYFHKYLRVIILHIGTKLYITDVNVTSWQECYGMSYDTPSNTKSTMDEYNNYVFVFTANGIFKILVDTYGTTAVLYYKINSEGPDRVFSGAGGSGTTYEYRMTYCMSRLAGTGQTRDRQTTGVYLQTESCPLQLQSSTNTDYGTVSNGIPPSGTDNRDQIGIFYVPTVSGSIKEYHWTHYSIYRTLDIGVNGINLVSGQGNNDQLYIWMKDVPVCKAFNISYTGASGLGSKFDVDTGTILKDDISNSISFVGTGGGTVWTVNELANSFTTLLGDYSGVTAGFIGAQYGGIMGQSGTTVTLYGSSDALTSSDVRKTLYLADGTYRHITSFTSSGVVEVAENTTVASGMAVCWNPDVRYLTGGILSDDVMRERIASYPLYNRFWSNLPDSNTGVVAGGFMFNGSINGNNVYYSQIPEGFEYLVGYYHPFYQTQFYKDQIRAIKELPDRIVVYSANSTRIVMLNVFDSVQLPDVGVDITVLSKDSLADDAIGVLDIGSIQHIDRGRHIMITNEPGIRIFDGSTYSDNLATDRIMDELRSFQTAVASIYTPQDGYIFWGTNLED